MLRSIVGISLAIVLLGCGGGSDVPELGEVSGTVKVDGTPKAGILVTFQPEDGRPSMGKTNDSGEYTLKYSESESGAKVGKNLVTITTAAPEGEEGEDGGCGGGDEEGFLDPIHPKYNSDAHNNPDMTKEVKAGDNEFNFEVETDLDARKAFNQGQEVQSAPCCSIDESADCSE